MAHTKLDVLAEKGYAILGDGPAIPPAEWEGLEYVDWKSGGDTNFAPLASAMGEMECAGFWDHGKPDKDGIWTSNREIAPTLCKYVEAIGARYGRVRVIKLNPSRAKPTRFASCTRTTTTASTPTAKAGSCVRGSSSTRPRDPSSSCATSSDDPSTESRIPLHPRRQLVIDTERLYHVVHNPGPGPRYALITSLEFGTC